MRPPHSAGDSVQNLTALFFELEEELTLHMWRSHSKKDTCGDLEGSQANRDLV